MKVIMRKIKIWTEWDENQSTTNAGNEIIKEYIKVECSSGGYELEENGTRNLYIEIQEANDGENIKELLRTIDDRDLAEAWEIETGEILDLTKIPQNRNEMWAELEKTKKLKNEIWKEHLLKEAEKAKEIEKGKIKQAKEKAKEQANEQEDENE